MCAAKTVETSFVQNMGAGRTEGSDKLNLSSSIPAQPIYCITHSKVNPKLIRLLARQHGQCNLAQILPSSEYIAIVQYFLHFLKGKYAILKPA